MDNSVNLSGKIALITGASRGIGAAVAKAYAKAGAHVVLIARNQTLLEKIDDEIQENGGQSTLLPLDLTNLDDIDKIGPSLHEKFGGLDIFIGNAAQLGTLTPITDIKSGDFEQIMTVNLNANFRLIKTLDPLLRQSPAGRVIFVTTGSEVVKGRAYWGSYAISKSAMETMANIYANETRNAGLKVNIINPGAVRTQMRAAAKPGENPLDLPTADTIVDDFLYLGSPECQKHGEIISVKAPTCDKISA